MSGSLIQYGIPWTIESTLHRHYSELHSKCLERECLSHSTPIPCRFLSDTTRRAPEETNSMFNVIVSIDNVKNTQQQDMTSRVYNLYIQDIYAHMD